MIYKIKEDFQFSGLPLDEGAAAIHWYQQSDVLCLHLHHQMLLCPEQSSGECPESSEEEQLHNVLPGVGCLL